MNRLPYYEIKEEDTDVNTKLKYNSTRYMFYFIPYGPYSNYSLEELRLIDYKNRANQNKNNLFLKLIFKNT